MNGRDMFNNEVLNDLIIRMSNANDRLMAKADKAIDAQDQAEATRLRNKAIGVRLAKSYAEEALRSLHASPS